MSTAPATEAPASSPVESSESHLAAADKFFAPEPPVSAPAPVAEPPKAVDKPVEPPAEKTVAPAVDPLAKILKTAAKAPAAPDVLPMEDIDKGLQAPADGSKSRAGWDELKKRAADERKLGKA